MVETYELYIEDERDERRFRALTCEPNELLHKVRDLIAAERARSAEVRQFGRPMFTQVG